jgi:GNAT superfamily N-acetyltransferase
MRVIKDAVVSDLHIIRSLAFTIWHEAYRDILSPEQLEYMLGLFYSPASLRDQLVILNHHFLIVTDKNIPVGFASYSPKDVNGTTYRLHKIYVLPEQQGSGTGKFLLSYVIDTIKSLGATSLELNVNRHNKARKFYEKQGFVTEGEVDVDIGNGYFMNDYIMRLVF